MSDAPAVNLPRLAAYGLLGGPIAAGLALTLAPAFGYLPALGGEALSLEPWRRLFAEPGLAASLRLTVGVGFAATALSLVLAFGLLAASPADPRGRGWRAALAPLLASPHSAIAIGLAFVLAPSGLLVRLFSPWATGLTLPPDLATINDPFGVALTIGLVVKETPFLIFVSLGALGQFPAAAQMRAARALGHARESAWLKIVAPQVYRRIRLPVYAVLAYSLSVVDMALVLAPSHPAPLSILGLRWFLSPDLANIFPAAAAAVLQLVVVVGAIGLWRIFEGLLARSIDAAVRTGARGRALALATRIAAGAGWGSLALGLASLVALVLWSLAWRWPFPRALPESWTLEILRRQASELARPLGATLALAGLCAAGALVLAIAWLESDDRRGRRSGAAAVYIPLLLPQLAFLFGAQTLFSALRIDGSFLAVAWAQSLFVFPYVMLALADPWRSLDPRYARAAAALGTSRNAALVRVKLPLLAGPLAVAFAIGVAVSIAQYLSTLFAGGGRIATLTTEALALAGGGDRRLAAAAGLAQALLPLIVYGAALLTPRLVHANRRGMLAA